jgi:hypothetical protein
MCFALPLDNGSIIRKVVNHKTLLVIKSSAKIQMCVDSVPQLVLHEIESAKCAFVFNKTKNLDISNLY